MSRSTKASGAADSPSEDLSFEEALKRLEGIVEAMEADDLALEALLARYEEGTKLVQVCQARLAAAEARIAVLERRASGEAVAEPGNLASAS